MEQKELTEEQKESLELTVILNTVVDVMDRKPIGTTLDSSKRIGEIVEELIKETKLYYGDIEDDKVNLISALAVYGYNSFGIEFIERLLENKEFTKSVFVSLIKVVAGNEEYKE